MSIAGRRVATTMSRSCPARTSSWRSARTSSCALRWPAPWPVRAWTTCVPRGTTASTSATTTPTGAPGAELALERRRRQPRTAARRSPMCSTCRSRSISPTGAGYVSVAAFYKDLETYVYTRNQIFDFTGYPTGTGVTPGHQPGHRFGARTTAMAAISGYRVRRCPCRSRSSIRRWKVSALQFSVSQTDSEIQPDPTQAPTALPGLSETVVNVDRLLRERTASRSGSRTATARTSWARSPASATAAPCAASRAENVVDAQIGYEFQSGPLEGLSVLFQVNNLTDEPFKTFQNGDERQVIDYPAPMAGPSWSG